MRLNSAVYVKPSDASEQRSDPSVARDPWRPDGSLSPRRQVQHGDLNAPGDSAHNYSAANGDNHSYPSFTPPSNTYNVPPADNMSSFPAPPGFGTTMSAPAGAASRVASGNDKQDRTTERTKVFDDKNA